MINLSSAWLSAELIKTGCSAGAYLVSTRPTYLGFIRTTSIALAIYLLREIDHPFDSSLEASSRSTVETELRAISLSA